MPSPTRRSTRSVLPSTMKPSTTDSSSSSAGSSRPDRATRAHREPSNPPQSQMDSAIDDPSENEEETGNDTTRCICGSQDYPGPPSTDENKSLSEDSGSFFIQCDKCNVWQHGGCIGIMAEEDSPDNYSCERCERRHHQLHTDQKGQRYSLYLPVLRRTSPNPRKGSASKEPDVKLKRDREMLARIGVDLSGPKRRSTMNSRQNYDEEEMLRKAIEESKGEVEPGSRKSKRGRDDSEEFVPRNYIAAHPTDDDDRTKPIKRQRTGSESVDAASTLHTGSIEADSDDDLPQSKSAVKRARAAAAETQRQREIRERERMRDQQREEAAGRRQARAGRRRAEGIHTPYPSGVRTQLKFVTEAESDEQLAENTNTADSMPPPSRLTSPSPPNNEPNQPSSSHKRSADNGRRTTRNQLLKDGEASPQNGKTSASSSSGEDAGKTTLKPDQSPIAAEPAVAASRPAKANVRSHKSKAAQAAQAAALAASKGESSGSETGKKSVPQPVSQTNKQVMSLVREVAKYEPEVRERASRHAQDSSASQTLRELVLMKAQLQQYASKHFSKEELEETTALLGTNIPPKAGAGNNLTASPIGLGVSA